jgi:signal transduction histidine kinase
MTDTTGPRRLYGPDIGGAESAYLPSVGQESAPAGTMDHTLEARSSPPRRRIWTRRRRRSFPAVGAAVFVGLASRGHEFRSVNQTAIIVLTIGAAYAVGRVTRLARVRGENAVALADLLRREQDLRAREAIAAERERLARELHDAIAHEVSVMVIQASAAQRMLDEDVESVRTSLVAVEQAGRQTIEELYLMLGLLRDDELTDVPPGLGRLLGLIERVRASGLPIELTMSGDAADVPAPVSLCAYRVVQESLTNVLKHTRDARADVCVHIRESSLRVDVRDDGGSGRPASTPPGSGGGLTGLGDRVRALGGAFHAGPCPDGGFVVGATLRMAYPT